MSRMTAFSSPFLLGFDQMEAMLDRIAKSSGDGYPPYNIERLDAGEICEALRITLAVAGFRSGDLDVTVEGSTLTIRGAQPSDDGRDYLHRGIAARRFERAFVLADGMEVTGAEIENGLLAIDLARPKPEDAVRRIKVADRSQDVV
jgi:HSP20 family molecular chaperone IbpA